MGSSICTTLVEVCCYPFLLNDWSVYIVKTVMFCITCFALFLYQVGELGRLSASIKKIEKELKNSDKYEVCFIMFFYNG